MDLQNSITEQLTCPICLDISKNPVESSCCRKVLCQLCASQLNICCICRSREFGYKESILAKRMIDSFPVICSHCGLKSTRGSIEEHEQCCDKAPLNCPICLTKYERSNILDHLYNSHKPETNAKINGIVGLLEKQYFKRNNPLGSPSGVISIEEKVNRAGHKAKLGSTGKYYCANALDVRCMCCNGYCGPSNGCNCSHCMLLDIQSRNLPKGWLVNREGFLAKKGSTGLYYCGRCVMIGVFNCDGYCGPDNGPNCL